MNGLQLSVLDEMITQASSQVGLLWPLDRAVAVNPLLDCLDEGFSRAVSGLGDRLGIDLWPSPTHLKEAARRGHDVAGADLAIADTSVRLPTMVERSQGVDLQGAESARAMVGQILLESALGDSGHTPSVLATAVALLRSRTGWTAGPSSVRDRAAQLLEDQDLSGLLALCGSWSVVEQTEELARHFARLPGWASWAKWNDCWAREPHRSGISRSDFLAVSLSIDLAWLEAFGSVEVLAPELPTESGQVESGYKRLQVLERAVHGEMLDKLASVSSASAPTPRFQAVMCIDVRSEPLRRALEVDPAFETFGFAGFFGIFAKVEPVGEKESYESLPVIAPPGATMTGGQQAAPVADGRTAAGGVFAQLTHEPNAMFALAETSGLLGSPWLLARSVLPSARTLIERSAGPWKLDVENDQATDIAEGALRGMGMTQGFAEEIVFLGHRSSTANNPHFATLECGACAGHAGGPNAAVLAGFLNDENIRKSLELRGISIPSTTRFTSGEHDTTRELVVLHGPASSELASSLQAATDAVAVWRASGSKGKVEKARKTLERRARDWAEVRPEWGLADHATFIVGPRSSTRSIDLGGRSFLHSYDPAADLDGSILGSILAAPMVVGQWINAAYYFSTVAPEVLGAGDKTLLNPVGDFAVISGDDPDLRLGLPWQSVATGDRIVHLPVRLLVIVEAPLERTASVVGSVPSVEQLVEGSWVRLVGREGPTEPWFDWLPQHGWNQR